MARNRFFPLAWLLLVAIPVTCFRVLDVDVWWHMEMGQAMLAQFSVPDLSLFYFTPVHEGVISFRFTWLGDIILFLTHHIGGDIGLQVLRLVLVSVSLWLLGSLFPRPRSLWTWLLLSLVLSGCYQLMLVRNALFSMPLLSLELWLWHQVRYQDKTRWVWGFPLLLTLWSFLHGSYLLGFAFLCLITLGDAMDWLRHPEDRPLSLHLTGALLLSLLGVLIKNPMTQIALWRMMEIPLVPIGLSGAILFGLAFLVLGYRAPRLFQAHGRKLHHALLGLLILGSVVGFCLQVHAVLSSPPGSGHLDVESGQIVRAQDSLWYGIKTAFNTIYWDLREDVLVSTEFKSPFDSTDFLFIWASWALALASLACLRRPSRHILSHMLPFFGILVLALGYQRMAGYLSLISAFVLAAHWESLPRWRHAPAALGVLAATLLVMVYTPLVFPSWKPGYFPQHHLGLGRIHDFSRTLPDYVLKNHGNEPVFNTIFNGGFLLHQWHPQKKIFVDGFFKPHRGIAFDTLADVLADGNAEILDERLNIELAIIGIRQHAWLETFVYSPNWYVEAMDEGMVLFSRHPDFNDPLPPFRMLLTQEDMEALPPSHQTLVTNRFLEAINTCLLKGRHAEARTLVETHGTWIQRCQQLASPATLEEFRRNMEVAETNFQFVNDPLPFLTMILERALSRGDRQNALRYLEAILQIDSSRWKRALQASQLALTLQYPGRAFEALSLVLPSSENAQSEKPDPGTMRSTWQQLVNMAIDKGQYALGLRALQAMSAWQVQPMNENTILQLLIQAYSSMEQSGRVSDALELLNFLDQTYPDSGHVHFYQAWHYFTHAEGPNDLQKAEALALEAVPIMKTESPHQLDAVYALLKEICKARGDMETAREFLFKAYDAAPPQRKELYRTL